MKKRDYLKQILGLVFGLVAFGAVSAQSAAPQALPWSGEDQKKAWIEANPSEYQRIAGQMGILTPGISNQNAASQSLPWGREDQKKAWIEANPAEYQRMGGLSGTLAPQLSNQAEKVEWLRNQNASKDPSVQIGIDHPSFPKYVSTGNTDLDNEKYESAKIEWIAKNPALYKAVCNEKEMPMSREERMLMINGKE